MTTRNINMFGCDIERFVKSVKETDTDFLMAAISVLSDAQELIESGEKEAARQAINRAKYLIDKTRQSIGRNELIKIK